MDQVRLRPSLQTRTELSRWLQQRILVVNCHAIILHNLVLTILKCNLELMQSQPDVIQTSNYVEIEF